MKSLTQFIIESTMNENFEDEKRKLLKCKVFKELFKAYTDCKKPEDLEEEDFDINDFGFLFNRSNISYTEFVKWLKSVWNERISDVKVSDLGNVYNVTFKMKGETFKLDFTEEY